MLAGMAIRTVSNPVILVGDTAADRPATLPGDGSFFDVALKQRSFFSSSAVVWYAENPTNTSIASVTALKAIPASSRYDTLTVFVTADQSWWYFSATSALTGDDILVATPAAGTGRWLRLPGYVDLGLPFTFATLDAAVLLTIPTGARFQLQNTYVEVTTAFTGGTTPGIGLSSNLTGYTAAGAVAGGAGGDLTAGLTAGVRPGVIGSALDADTEIHDALLVAANTVLFERIADVFTAGVGIYHLCGHLQRNAGA